MRDIKFRAWDGSEMINNESLCCHSLSWGEISVGDYVLMQYTGLKDRHGVEIYEGDIVKAASAGQHAECEVKWGKGRAGFFLYRKSGGIVWNLSGGGVDYNQENIEVIGNIYENPELA